MIVLLFLKSLWSGVLGLVGKVIGWFAEHPRVLMYVMCGLTIAALSAYIAARWTETRNRERIHALELSVDRYEAADKARKVEIKQLEESSKKAANDLQTNVAKSKEELHTLSETYAAQLKAAQSKEKVVIVKVPGSTVEVPVYIENGSVVCNQLPQVFADKINEMVGATNNGLKVEGQSNAERSK